ncbi:MAG: HlyC/CorC family transporter [Verrucomicrobia bacterium]|nr:HlyC/CorC family transporter [Verrucomicrobiota bacterium]
MSSVATEFIIIFLLLAANGVFAMTEIAVVSARKARLRRLAQQGDARAKAALELAESPNRFLSTVQVGITLVGVLAGAFGGATVAEQIAQALQDVPPLARYGEAIGISIVVLVITYLSLIIGELVPKRLALAHPERIARFMARPMTRLSVLAGPVVKLLGLSTDLVLRLIGVKADRPPQVTEDEVKGLVEEGVAAGVFSRAEPQMVESVLALDRMPVKDIMTPRAKIIWLNRADPHEAIWHKIVVSAHSNFPVYEGSRDNVVGVVSVKSIYANLAAGATVRLGDLMTPPLLVPAASTVTQLLDSFKRSGRHFALVNDEFGGIAGAVTLVDVLEAVVGDIPSQEERSKPSAHRRADGSWLIDGLLEMDELARQMPDVTFPRGPERDYQTVAGFVLAQLGRVPREGETFEWQGHRFEVIDMDHQRVDKVLALPLPSAPHPQTGPAPLGTS